MRRSVGAGAPSGNVARVAADMQFGTFAEEVAKDTIALLRAACETKSCQGDKGVAERRRATAVEKLLIEIPGSVEAAMTWYGQECGWEDSRYVIRT